MTKRRQPIKFDELETRGRGAILRSRAEIQAEEEALSGQNAGIPASRLAGSLGYQTAGQHEAPAGTRIGYRKVTYRISPEALEAIDEIKRVLRRQYGIKASLEEIAEEAILAAMSDLEQNKQTSFLVNKFSGLPES